MNEPMITIKMAVGIARHACRTRYPGHPLGKIEFISTMLKDVEQN